MNTRHIILTVVGALSLAACLRSQPIGPLQEAGSASPTVTQPALPIVKDAAQQAQAPLAEADAGRTEVKEQMVAKGEAPLRLAAPAAGALHAYGAMPYSPVPAKDFNTESYKYIAANDFQRVSEAPLSTFSADVDTASYANVRRFIHNGVLPPPDAVRIEELVNYFPYAYPEPKRGEPFGVKLDMAAAPWNPAHRLVRVGLRAKSVEAAGRKDANLVFLLDVSGSMATANKLPLVIESMKLLASQLRPEDRVSIVVYAGASGLVLPPTRGSERGEIVAALERLSAGGSTNGGEGLVLAYQVARENFIENGVNRVILATDGDFNVGVTGEGDLVRLVQKNAKSGVYLTVLGFGMGNYKDSMLEEISGKGNGNYAYVDTRHEARKLFIEQLGGTLQTVAKDVKFQIEFNPAVVSAYRLVGYENRLLKDHEFNDDQVDAGDVGAGHTVTALYEIVLAGDDIDRPRVDPLKYQRTAKPQPTGDGEALTLKIRYKEPDGHASKLLSYTLDRSEADARTRDADFRFAAGVAAWGMLLRESPHKGSATPAMVLDLVRDALADDANGHRAESVSLVHKSGALLRVNASIQE